MKANTKMKNTNSQAQSRPEQLSTLKLPKIDLALRRANRMLNTEKLLGVLQSETSGFFELAEVVGQWVWISFPEKQPPTVTMVLAQLGFHWNNNRQSWQHPCGTLIEEPSTYDPRRRYHSYFPSRAKAA